MQNKKHRLVPRVKKHAGLDSDIVTPPTKTTQTLCLPVSPNKRGLWGPGGLGRGPISCGLALSLVVPRCPWALPTLSLALGRAYGRFLGFWHCLVFTSFFPSVFQPFTLQTSTVDIQHLFEI